MKHAFHFLAALLVAVSLHAATIDLATAASVRVNAQDTLSFELFTTSYSAAASQFGFSSGPGVFSFSLLTAQLTTGPTFSASLRSAESSTQVALGRNLDFTDGYFSSPGFQGAVSILQGQFHLDSQSSQQFFQSGYVWLDLTDLGGSLNLGLSPRLLRNDLFASFSGGPLSVGAPTGDVQLKEAAPSLTPHSLALGVNAFAAPEPATYWMFATGAGLLFTLSHTRIKARR
jgi:hypothetical protein